MMASKRYAEVNQAGRKHERYLKEHRSSVWARLVLTEELLRHFYEVDIACNEQMEYLVRGRLLSGRA